VGTDADARPDAPSPRHDTTAPIRATQPVPPALRRAVLVRDQHCWLCGAHHRAAHQGALLIEKDAGGEIRFYHGDGTSYGQALEPQALDVQVKLFSALRNMGFKECEVRAVLELRRDDDLRGASIQHLLGEALRRIRPPRSKSVQG
jgi:hypothetical protein